MEQDIYDLEVERLTKEPEDIYNSWQSAKPLFKFVGNVYDETEEHIELGCLTQIRNDFYCGAFIKGKYDEGLTKKIRNDELLPSTPDEIQVKHLPRFAYWQRRIDALNQQ
jgi:hypothetical protein